MENQFIPYEQALELKELGFNEECIASYTQTLRFDVLEQNGLMWHTVTNEKLKEYEKACTAPLYQQAFRWFRKKYGFYSIVDVDQTMEPKFCYTLSKYKGDFQWDNILPTYSELYYTYEEAELACLRKLIELVKNK